MIIINNNSNNNNSNNNNNIIVVMIIFIIRLLFNFKVLFPIHRRCKHKDIFELLKNKKNKRNCYSDDRRMIFMLLYILVIDG